jgi:predicted nucleic-acid-binding protein
VKITADTNILVRLITEEDADGSRLAQKMVETAELLAIPVRALVELCWVLKRAYGVAKADVARAVRALIHADSIATDFPAVEAGLMMLDKGGGFADDIIAHEGIWLGGETFMNFDRKAVKLLTGTGISGLEPA